MPLVLLSWRLPHEALCAHISHFFLVMLCAARLSQRINTPIATYFYKGGCCRPQNASGGGRQGRPLAPPSSPVGAAATRVATAPVATALYVFDPNEQVTFTNSTKVALEAIVGWGLLLGAVFAERRASWRP